MKARTIFAVSLFLASVPALGQGNQQKTPQNPPDVVTVSSYSEAYLRQAVRNYAQGLTSDCNGVVESALAHTALLRILKPRLDLREIQATIAGLSESGRTPVIRYKAYLATMVFESPASFAGEMKSESIESDQFFSEIAAKVQKTLLGQNLK